MTWTQPLKRTLTVSKDIHFGNSSTNFKLSRQQPTLHNAGISSSHFPERHIPSN